MIFLAALQRTPALRPELRAVDRPPARAPGASVGGVVAAWGKLGSVHTLAGASAVPLVVSSGSASGVTVAADTSVAIAYTVSGTATMPSSWTITGQIPPGLNFSGLTAPGTVNVDQTETGYLFLTGNATQAGTFSLALQAWEGENASEVSSPIYSYQIIVLPSASNPPVFTVQPQDQSITVGQTAVLTAAATGNPQYQWQFDGSNIAGATGPSLTLADIQPSAAGIYAVIATNSGGPAFSRNASLTVTNAANAPVFIAQPAQQTIATGSTVVFSAAASGVPVPAYQWYFNGAAVVGAASPTLVIASAAAANAGLYSCVAINSGGVTASNQANLTVISTNTPGRLINLSVESIVGPSQGLTVGLVSGGAGTSGSQSLLARATGPALAAFGLTGVLPDPALSVFSGSNAIAADDNWGTPPSNAAAVAAADTAVGAFPLTNPASMDSALVISLPEGPYTVQVSGNGPTAGVALAEVYDLTAPSAYTLATPRLINLSCLTAVAAHGSLAAGFVIGGVTARTVLIRAIGPALAAFGLTGATPDPTIALHTVVNGQDTVLSSNASWGGDPQTAAVMADVGAFSLSPTSADSVVLGTYAPGLYTAVAGSVSGTAGSTLIEVYEVP